MATRKTAATGRKGGTRKSSKSATAAKDTKEKNITIKGKRFKLPASLPYSTLRLINAPPGPVGDAMLLEEILGPEQMEEVWDLGLSMEEGIEFAVKTLEKYGMKRGESPASAQS